MYNVYAVYTLEVCGGRVGVFRDDVKPADEENRNNNKIFTV